MSGSRLVNRRSRVPIYLAGAALILCVAFLDWWTGPEVYMAFLYIIPVTVVAWGAGRDPGFFTAWFSVLFALGVELGWRRHYSHPFAPYFSALLLLGLAIYSATVIAAIAERERKLREETLVRQRAEAKLNTANETLELRVAERSAGARGYITKQEATTKVLGAIRKILGGEVYLSDETVARLLNRCAQGQNFGASPVEALADRELEVFQMIGRGLGTRQIAEELRLGIKTVESYRARIKEKLSLENAAELVKYAIQWVNDLESK